MNAEVISAIKMEKLSGEIVDRMTIVKLKVGRIGNPKLEKEMGALKNALDEFKKKGVEIKQERINELYYISSKKWNLLDKMNEERKDSKNFEKIGRLYLDTEQVNKKRAMIINKIAEETKEIKKSSFGVK